MTTSPISPTSAVPAAGRTAGPYHYEDFEPGRLFAHHWGRTLTEADAVLFATQTHQYQPALFNAAYAAHLGHRDRPVSELLTFSVVLGLSVADLTESGGPFLGADEMSFGVPVYVGDTLDATSVVVSRRESGSRPGWGVVRWRTVGTNQHGDMVVHYQRSSLVRRRPEETGADT
ncbi:MaoC family dehydratase [Pseudonocardia ailaonensis]|uniref:MaoC family dehydratase n=1 Tax=Pseudonocardia ailaonensis TaxID=367279 RepID=A0ABN2N649_9PSEU